MSGRRAKLIAECRERAAKRLHRIRVKAGRKAWRKGGKRHQWESYKRLAMGRAVLAAKRVVHTTGESASC